MHGAPCLSSNWGVSITRSLPKKVKTVRFGAPRRVCGNASTEVEAGPRFRAMQPRDEKMKTMRFGAHHSPAGVAVDGARSLSHSAGENMLSRNELRRMDGYARAWRRGAGWCTGFTSGS